MGGIYGVFVCLTYPGLGKPADAELAQGKLAANLALKYQVRHLIYSSSELAPESKDNPAKMMIEAHVKELGAQHDEFKWTILRPAFFYENFDGLLGSVSECLFESSMDKGTKIQMVGGEDIGRVAGAVFEAGQEYHGATITVCGDCLTSKEVNAVHKKVMGRPLTRIPGFVGSVLRGSSFRSWSRCRAADASQG
ncbi:NADP-binding protein [Dacryopinax primogenitus]|uniref:NADP-binding protein n=1 Tax=Dacryopinax primogenitus (strain DJM 731) TaxID=1858805 RepID=M5G6W8_DACPD|nr:NADP-binding protein [Dacryopinax primogenitus]EJT99502.1 NADP-binding protein [Dacryopinax primogenitus]